MKKLDLFDFFIFIGLIVLCVGIWMISIPAALITGGAITLLLGLFGASAGNTGKAIKK